MKRTFSLIELIIVIIIIGILASSMKFSLSDNSLNQAANQVVRDILYAKHLALVDAKYQPYPDADNEIEKNRSKYWFKQWWQVRFAQDNDGTLWYEVFSDQPYDKKSLNFNRIGSTPSSGRDMSFAKSPISGKYLIGKCGSNYPNCEDIDKHLDLTNYYSIKKIIYTNMYSKKNSSIRIIFDNYGRVYLYEGEKGDAGDTNPYDVSERKPLTKIAKITLCKDDNCENNKSICIYPKTGFVNICE